MSTAIALQKSNTLTATDLRAQVNLVQEVMKAVMKEGTHYGTIPNTPKPSLWKPGAEVLAATFRIAVSYRIEDLSTLDVVRYRITATGTHQTTRIVMGDGMGECSSGEEKYKWRKSLNKREFDATPENHRRTKFGYDKYKKQEYEILQVRTEPVDHANTILKMACKRAQIAMTLNVTAASDIFTQDIEDLPDELRPDIDRETGEITPPTRAQLPPCPDAKIDRWFENVTAGKAKANELLAFAKGRYTLSDVQEGRILAFVSSKSPAINAEYIADFVAEMNAGEQSAERQPGEDDA